MRDLIPAPCLRAPRAMIVAALFAVSCALGGCAGGAGGGASASFAMAPSGGGSTVAFESIDGPPPDVFRRLVADLNAEAGTRKIAVVSRESAATYRVRGYVSALVERDKTTFAWVWDVYDADKRRALRISGEEPVATGKAVHRMLRAASFIGVVHDVAIARFDERVARGIARREVGFEVGEILDIEKFDAL